VLAADRAGEAIFDIREPNVIGPSVTADRKLMATVVVRAIVQDAAQAAVAHLSKRDLLLVDQGFSFGRVQPISKRCIGGGFFVLTSSAPSILWLPFDGTHPSFV
jgi:hypothetical protein